LCGSCVCFCMLSQKWVISFWSNESTYFCEIRKEYKWHLCNVVWSLWGRGYKKSSVFELHKQFKEGHENMKMMKEVVIQGLTELMKMLRKCRIWCIQTDFKVSSKLIMWKYSMYTGFSKMIMLQPTRHSLSTSSWPKNQGTPILFL
jgi:hypothetical protein